MPQTISKIGIKDSSGTGYDTRDIGAKGQNVEVGYDASGKIILDVDAQTPTTTKQLTKVLQDAEKNILDLDDSKAPDNHAWSDADSGVNHGLADGTYYGHIKVGDGLTVNSGKVDVSYGDSANTACEGNDSRLSNARKNPNAITFTDGTTNMSYDGSEAKTVNATTIGAAPSGHTSVQATGSILGHVKTGTGITNNAGTISVSYGTTAGTACQGNDNRLSDSRTPKSHAATETTYGSGTSSNYGHVKLTDTYSVTTPNASTNGANTGIAASAYALQQAYNTLNSNLNKIGETNNIETIWTPMYYPGAGQTLYIFISLTSLNMAQQIEITEILNFNSKKIINSFWVNKTRASIGWSIQISTNETIPLTPGYSFSQLRIKIY